MLLYQINPVRVILVTPIPLARMVNMFSLPTEPLCIQGTPLTPKMDEG